MIKNIIDYSLKALLILSVVALVYVISLFTKEVSKLNRYQIDGNGYYIIDTHSGEVMKRASNTPVFK